MGPHLRHRRWPASGDHRSRRPGSGSPSALIQRGLRGGLLGLALVVLAAGGCKGPDLALDYGQTALENYELAVGEFEDRDWEEAISYADFVRIRFPFSRYAVEAELLVARAEFEQGNYAIAQDAFKQFARLHPTYHHVRNGWVSYMAAVSAFMNAPDGVGIMPPYYQRDQTGLRDALGELRYFFDHYAASEMEPLARELRDQVNRRLLRHEIYVARFYLDRKRPDAAIGRLETAHREYPGIGLDAEVLFLLGLTYLRMEEIELSRATFAELQGQHPTHHHGRQARLYLKYIYDTYGPADPSRARPDRSPPKPAPPPRPKNPDKPTKPGARDPGDAPAESPSVLDKTKVIPAPGTNPEIPEDAPGPSPSGAKGAQTQGAKGAQTQGAEGTGAKRADPPGGAKGAGAKRADPPGGAKSAPPATSAEEPEEPAEPAELEEPEEPVG